MEVLYLLIIIAITVWWLKRSLTYEAFAVVNARANARARSHGHPYYWNYRYNGRSSCEYIPRQTKQCHLDSYNIMYLN